MLDTSPIAQEVYSSIQKKICSVKYSFSSIEYQKIAVAFPDKIDGRYCYCLEHSDSRQLLGYAVLKYATQKESLAMYAIAGSKNAVLAEILVHTSHPCVAIVKYQNLVIGEIKSSVPFNESKTYRRGKKWLLSYRGNDIGYISVNGQVVKDRLYAMMNNGEVKPIPLSMNYGLGTFLRFISNAMTLGMCCRTRKNNFLVLPCSCGNVLMDQYMFSVGLLFRMGVYPFDYAYAG